MIVIEHWVHRDPFLNRNKEWKNVLAQWMDESITSEMNSILRIKRFKSILQRFVIYIKQ